MKYRKIAACVSLLTLLHSGTGWAGVVPGRWEKVEAQQQGVPLRVRLKSGEEPRVFYQGLDQDMLALKTAGGRDIQIGKAAVVRVLVVRDRSDSRWNGAAIGAAVGFAPMATLASRESADLVPLGVIVIGLVGAAVGLGIGYVIDGALPEDEVLYEAMRP